MSDIKPKLSVAGNCRYLISFQAYSRTTNKLQHNRRIIYARSVDAAINIFRNQSELTDAVIVDIWLALTVPETSQS